MASLVATFGLILLSGFVVLSAAKGQVCDIYAAVGESVTLPFVYEKLGNSHTMRWTHNSTIIFYRHQGKVSIGQPHDITVSGSIVLKNLKLTSSGIYKIDVLNPNGSLAKTWTGQLCVMEKVSKPQVKYICNSNAVNLECSVAKTQDLVFSWTLNKKLLPSETRQTLSVSLSQLKDDNSFSCSVENKISRESSQTVQPTCKSPVTCFKTQNVLAVLAGGAGLIFLLLITVIVLCCRQGCNRTQKKDGGRGGLRMVSVKQREFEFISPDYETMHNIQNSPSPSPKPSPRSCYQNVSQHDVQPENRPLQLYTAAEGQQSSPVPKPRTKNAQNLNK